MYVSVIELIFCTVFVGIVFPLVSVIVGVWSSYRTKAEEDGGGKTGAGAASPTMDIDLGDMAGFRDDAAAADQVPVLQLAFDAGFTLELMQDLDDNVTLNNLLGEAGVAAAADRLAIIVAVNNMGSEQAM